MTNLGRKYYLVIKCSKYNPAVLDPKKVQEVEDLLNNRPRKVLGYLTPFEAMAKNELVALRS